jgi:putative endonuclease
MTYYVYILANRTNVAIYTGVTRDLIRRVYEHKHHAAPNSYTAKYNIDRLVYFEQTSDIYAALEREKQIKSWKRAKKNELVEGMNPQWEDLYPTLLG